MVTTEVQLRIEKSEQALLQAPVIYMDGAQAFAANSQVVKFNLFQDRLVGAPGIEIPIERVVCARLVMSPITLVQLADWLAKRAEEVKAAVKQAAEAIEPSEE